MKNLVIFIAIGFSCFINMWGSGTYPGKLGKTPSGDNILQYQLGKSIFIGKKKLPTEANNTKDEQLKILVKVQEKLPSRVKKKYDVRTYAGRLSADELKALLFYLGKRYRIRNLN